MSEGTRVSLARIRTDGGTQSRASLSEEAIAEYTEAYSSRPKDMPPVVVFYDGEEHWLADGFHRVKAALAAGRTSILADVRQGTQRDAILHSVGANSSHGLRRTNADKRRAVLMLLKDDEWGKRSDRWAAEKCGVGHQLVATMRAQLGESSSRQQARQGQDGKTRRLPARSAPKLAISVSEREVEPLPSESPVRQELDVPASGERIFELADVIPLTTQGARELVEQPAAFSFADEDELDERDANSALRDLDEDIERHIKAWEWPPGGLVAALEGWARRARIMLAERDERIGNG